MANQYSHPKPATNLPSRLDEDLWTLTTATVKAALGPASWAYLAQLHKKRAEGRLSSEAFDNALTAHCDALVKAVAAQVA